MSWWLLAQEMASDPNRASGTVLVIYLLAPIVILFFFWLLASRSSRKQLRPLQERSMEHADRLEAKTDEMIALPKEISAKLDRSRP